MIKDKTIQELCDLSSDSDGPQRTITPRTSRASVMSRGAAAIWGNRPPAAPSRDRAWVPIPRPTSVNSSPDVSWTARPHRGPTQYYSDFVGGGNIVTEAGPQVEIEVDTAEEGVPEDVADVMDTVAGAAPANQTRPLEEIVPRRNRGTNIDTAESRAYNAAYDVALQNSIRDSRAAMDRRLAEIRAGTSQLHRRNGEPIDGL